MASSGKSSQKPQPKKNAKPSQPSRAELERRAAQSKRDKAAAAKAKAQTSQAKTSQPRKNNAPRPPRASVPRSPVEVALNTKQGRYPSRTDAYVSKLRFNLFRGSTTPSATYTVTSTSGEHRQPFFVVHPNLGSKHLYAVLPGSGAWTQPINTAVDMGATTKSGVTLLCSYDVVDGLIFNSNSVTNGAQHVTTNRGTGTDFAYASGFAARDPPVNYGLVGKVMACEVHLRVQCEGPTSGEVLVRMLDESHNTKTPAAIADLMLGDTRGYHCHRFKLKQGTHTMRFIVPIEDVGAYRSFHTAGTYQDGIARDSTFPIQLGQDRHPFGGVAIAFNDIQYSTTTSLPPLMEVKVITAMRVHLDDANHTLVKHGSKYSEEDAHDAIVRMNHPGPQPTLPFG